MSGMLMFVAAHRRPSVWTLHAKMRAELDAALRGAQAEPSPARRRQLVIRAYAAALKSAWKDA